MVVAFGVVWEVTAALLGGAQGTVDESRLGAALAVNILAFKD